MLRVLKQCALLTLLGASLAAALAGARGLPELAPPAAEDATCSAPGGGALTPQWVSVEEAKALFLQGGTVFLDARTTEDFARGHVAGALSVPVALAGNLPEALLQLLGSASTIVVYCDTTGGCGKSTKLANRIAISLHTSHVRVLEGGMPEWLSKAYPAESGPCIDCPWLKTP